MFPRDQMWATHEKGGDLDSVQYSRLERSWHVAENLQVDCWVSKELGKE